MVTMEGSIKYMESSHMHSTKFMRNSKAVGVLWGIFSVCYSIITIVVFMQVREGRKQKGSHSVLSVTIEMLMNKCTIAVIFDYYCCKELQY